MAAPNAPRLLLVLACFLLLCPALAGQEKEGKIKIAIVAFDDPGSYGYDPLLTGPMGRETADTLAQGLSRTKEFIVTERAVADRLFVGVSQTALNIDQQTLIRQGKALGIDYFILGRVDVNWTQTALYEPASLGEAIVGTATKLAGYEKRAKVTIHFRIVNAASAEVLHADEGQGQVTRTYSTPGFNNALLRSAVEAATSDALAKLRGYAELLVKAPWERAQEEELAAAMRRLHGLRSVEGRILGQAPDGSYVVNVGSDHGLAEGDLLKVMGEEVIRDVNTGAVLFTETAERGTLKVTRVQAERAQAVPTEGAGFVAGDAIRSDVSALEKQVAQTFTREPTAQELFERGQRLYNARLYRPALKDFDQARTRMSETDPQATELVTWIGKAHIQLGEVNEAASAWSWAIKHGQPMKLDAYHRHFSGTCRGAIIVTTNAFRFEAPQQDHSFEAPLQGLGFSASNNQVQVNAAPLGKHKPKRWDLLLGCCNERGDLLDMSSFLSQVISALRR